MVVPGSCRGDRGDRLPVVAGGCRESERLKEPGPQEVPGSPRKSQEGANRAKECKTPYIYRCIQGF